MLLIYVLFVYTVLLNGCSKDNDTINDEIVSCNTFLKCNDNTTWKQVFIENDNEVARTYLKLRDNLVNPFENWLNFSPSDCYYHMQLSDHQFEIIENSINKLTVKIVWQEEDWQQDEFETWTFTKQSESLMLVTQYFQEVITFNFTSASEDLGELEICTE